MFYVQTALAFFPPGLIQRLSVSFVFFFAKKKKKDQLAEFLPVTWIRKTQRNPIIVIYTFKGTKPTRTTNIGGFTL